MPYRYQYAITIALTVVTAGFAVIVVSDPGDLGLSPIALRWIGVIQAMIATALTFLPKITKPPNDERVGQD